MAEEKDDQAFKDYLRGDSGLSRRYRAGKQAQPSEHLDDAIIAAARKEAASRPRPVHSPFGGHWYVPVSLAAVLVICVSIVFTIYREHGHQLLTGPAPEGLSDSDMPAAGTRESAQAGLKKEIAPPATSAPLSKDVGKPDATKRKLSASESAGKEGRIENRAAAEQRDDGTELELQGATSSDAAMSTQPQEQDKLSSPESAVTGEIEQEAAKQQDIQMRAEPKALRERNFKMDEGYAAISDPEQWFEEINHLWDAGKKEEAVKTLEHFLEIFPDYPRDQLRNKLRADIDLSEYTH